MYALFRALLLATGTLLLTYCVLCCLQFNFQSRCTCSLSQPPHLAHPVRVLLPLFRSPQEMQNEVHLLGSLSHPNIMRFMAVSLDPPTIVMQVRVGCWLKCGNNLKSGLGLGWQEGGAWPSA